MNAIPEPSDVVAHARMAARRDTTLAGDIGSLGSAQMRSALYWLAADPDGDIHVAVNAAVQGQIAAAEPVPAPFACRHCGSEGNVLLHTDAGPQCAEGVDCARRQAEAGKRAAA
jgi:hypothetical protein